MAEKATKSKAVEVKDGNKDPRKIYLRNVKVVFSNLVDEGFGRSITIDATEPEVATLIGEWVEANNIGKAPNAGKAQFKTYEDTIQYALRLNDNTKFVYSNGLDEKSLGYQSVVSLAANAFDYDNKFGKATSASLSAVIVHKGKASGADEDISELMGDVTDDIADGEAVDLKDQPF